VIRKLRGRWADGFFFKTRIYGISKEQGRAPEGCLQLQTSQKERIGEKEKTRIATHT
jgi:hypothetical protein